MNGKHHSFVQGLDFLAKRLFTEDWGRYAGKLLLKTEDGFPKYQGFLFVGTGPFMHQRYAHPVGFLMDNALSAKTLMRKFNALEIDEQLVASIQVRYVVQNDLENAIWGGAVRSSHNSNVIYGGTGLPETVDNLSVSAYLHHTGELTTEDYLIAVSYENAYIQQACEMVGMSESSYSRMRSFIESVVGRH